jgi:hypothetical protein
MRPGAGFSPNTSISPSSFIPSMFHIQLHLHVAIKRWTSGQNLGTLKKQLFRKLGATGSGSTFTFFILQRVNIKPITWYLFMIYISQ